MSKKIMDKMIDEGVCSEEIANKFSGEYCVYDFGMEVPYTCHEGADCNDCWIKGIEELRTQ